MNYKTLYLVYLAILVGCTQAPAEVTQVGYTMPQGYETQTYTVVSHTNGYDVEQVEIPHTEYYDRQGLFEAWQEDREAADKLAMMNSVYATENQPFYVLEEKRIEDFCKEEGYRYCKDIDRTCNEEGCYSVTVMCDDDFYDEGLDEYEECRRFEVEVSEDIDDELTEKVNEEEEA